MTSCCGTVDWADREHSWRMRCSCGWVEETISWNKDDAVRAANRHISSSRKHRWISRVERPSRLFG